MTHAFRLLARPVPRALVAVALLGALCVSLPSALLAAPAKRRAIVSQEGVAPVPEPGSKRSFG